MKPFNNCYIIKNTSDNTIKIIRKDNKRIFVSYIVDKLDFDNELTITTGLYEEPMKINDKEKTMTN